MKIYQAWSILFLVILVAGAIQDLSEGSTTTKYSLLEPQTTGNNDIRNVLGFNQQERSKINSSFSLESLSQLVWSGQGVTHPPGRTVPSAGATYPLDLYISSKFEMEYLPSGKYHYLPNSHELETINTDRNFDTIVADSLSSFEKLQYISSPFRLFVTAEYERTANRYGQRAERYVHLEVGHLIQNVLLQAKARNIQTSVIMDFPFDVIRQSLGFDYDPLVIFLFWETGTLETDETASILLSENEISVEEAIFHRKSVREYTEDPLSQSDLSDLIRYSYYHKDPWDGEWVIPSLTGVFPVELYIAATEVSGLEQGIYRFQVEDNSFVQISNDPKREELWENSLNQNWVLNAPISLVLTIDQSQLRLSSLDNAIHQQVARMEAGIIAQNLYLISYVLGLGTVVIGAFNDKGIRGIVGASVNEDPLYVITVGNVYTSFLDVEQINISGLASLFGWISWFAIYLSCLIMTPPLRKRLRSRGRTIHLLLGLVAFLSVCLHLTFSHGGLGILRNVSWENLRSFLASSIFSLSIGSDRNLYQFGLVVVRNVFWLSLVLGSISIKNFFWAHSKRVNRVMKPIHQYAGYFIIFAILFHGIVNGSWLTYYGIILWPLFTLSAFVYVASYYWKHINHVLDKIRSLNS